jgi:recombinational DNA repair protein (RecF pathway)
VNDQNLAAGVRELAREPRTVIRSVIQRSLPGLEEVEVDEMLTAAQATKGRALRELADHLFAHPEALHSEKAEGPLALFRVLDQLASKGYPVALPRCTGCGKHTTKLARSAPSGRVCDACAAKTNKQDCDRCGRQQVRIMARRADGRICNFCYLTDPERIEPCARCGRSRNPVTRLDDGGPICKKCWHQPHQQCSLCRRDEPAPYTGKNGPICARCYRRHQQRRVPCGRCGEIRTVARRAKDGEPGPLRRLS